MMRALYLADEIDAHLDHGVELDRAVLLECASELRRLVYKDGCYRIIYRSKSLMSTDGESELLAQSQDYNRIAGVTGCLFHHDGYFIQVLEGEEEVVRGLYARIERDKRHKQIVLLQSGRVHQRRFLGWWMGSITLCADEYKRLVKSLIGTTEVDAVLLDFLNGGKWR